MAWSITFSAAADVVGCGHDAVGEDEFIEVGARGVVGICELRVADRIWRVQRQQVECSGGRGLYRETGGASSDDDLSGGVRCIFETAWDFV